jgi:hypothetical protein
MAPGCLLLNAACVQTCARAHVLDATPRHELTPSRIVPAARCQARAYRRALPAAAAAGRQRWCQEHAGGRTQSGACACHEARDALCSSSNASARRSRTTWCAGDDLRRAIRAPACSAQRVGRNADCAQHALSRRGSPPPPRSVLLCVAWCAPPWCQGCFGARLRAFRRRGVCRARPQRAPRRLAAGLRPRAALLGRVGSAHAR